jgi:HrpA-like RNA helicase
VQNAIELLKTIGALDITEELTPLGKVLEPWLSVLSANILV